MGLFQYLLGNQQNKWDKGALVNVLNTLNNVNTNGVNQAGVFANSANNGANNNLNLGNATLSNPNGGLGSLQDQLTQALGGLNPSQFTGGSAASQAAGLLNNPQNGTLQTLLSSLAANGGIQNPGQSAGQKQALDLFGGNTGSQGQLGNIGGTLGASGGLTQQLFDIQNAGAGVVNNFGHNQNTDAGMNAAQAIASNYGDTPGLQTLSNSSVNGLSGQLGTPGLTQTGAAGEQSALSGLNSGGQTDFTNALQKQGLNYASQPAILPTGLAASISRDQAGANAKNAAQAFQAQALARGGGPGAVVANGAANSGLADFADQISNAQSNGFENALLSQQGLNLQQQGQGAQMGLGAANTAAQQLGTYSGLLNNLEGTANQRYGINSNNLLGVNSGQNANVSTGLSGITGLQNAQTNLAGTYGGLANSASQQTTNRASAGASTLNDLLNSQLSGGNLQNGQLNTSLQGLLGANSGFNSGLGTNLSGLTNLAGLNQQGNVNYNNLLNSLLNTGNGINNTGAGLTNSGLGSLGNLTGQYLNYAQTGITGQPGIFSSYASNGSNGYLNNQGQAITSLAAALSGGGGG